MLRLRPYKTCDAEKIVTWFKDERSFRKWSSDRWEAFPITAEDMNKKYVDFNGDCIEPDNFYPMTAFDDSGIVGHLIMRFLDEKKTILRFGFVVLDDTKRGKGYGKEMIRLALKFAFEILRVEKVTIGVFDNNPAAYNCYRAVGFTEIGEDKNGIYKIMGEDWKCIELEIGNPNLK